MKNDGWIGKRGIRYWYYRYRDSEFYMMGIVGITILVCVLLLFYVIIPELSRWFSIRDEVIATQQRITVLQNNITFMDNVNRDIVDGQLLAVSQALPPSKNFNLILQSISRASAVSGIALGDYSFPVGNIASSDQNDSGGGVSNTSINLVVTGTVDQLKKFISTIENSAPIAEVVGIDGAGSTTSLTIQYYQKPFPSLNLTGDTPLSDFTAAQTVLLQQLSSWENNSSSGNPPQPMASASAIPVF